MEITGTASKGILELTLRGRLDAFGAKQLQTELENPANNNTVTGMIWNMQEVNYLSSAGLRVLLAAQKQLAARGGGVILAGLQTYCRDVIATAGFEQLVVQFDNLADARRHALQMTGAVAAHSEWAELETAQTELADYRFIPLKCAQGGSINVLGDVKDVLHANATPERLASKRFFAAEYSLGLGGLGEQVADYFRIMGEMMTVGGTMIWLPTDGHDTPDFMIPKNDSRDILIHTTFNVTLAGGFNEYVNFKARTQEGLTISELYRDLFGLARQRRQNFKGILGMAARLQMTAVLASGVKKSPVHDFAPGDGKLITHPAHMAEWFDCDAEPRHRNVTGLMVGLGADLTADLSDYDDELLNRVFYLHPANISGKTAMLHNHMVVFSSQTMPDQAANLEDEIQTVIAHGDFLDMRHLLDASRANEGLLGLNYVNTLCKEEAQPEAQIMPQVIRQQKLDYYRKLT